MDQTARTIPATPWQATVATALLTGLLVFGSAWVCIELTRETGRIAAIWLANAVMLAGVLKRSKSDWPLLLAVGWLAIALARVVSGDSLAIAALLATSNGVEVALCAALVTWLAREPNFRAPRPMAILAVVALGPASLASAGLAASAMLAMGERDFANVFMTWYGAHALGLVTLTPMLLMSAGRDLIELFHPTMRPRLVLVSIVLLATLSAIFLQSTMPLLFLAFPAIVVATFALGFVGASLAVIVTGAVALWATMNHMGPISLMHDGPRLQIIALQLFAAALGLTGVAVATLLGERDLLSAALLQSPGFQYIKNHKGEFVSVNMAVARRAGYAHPRQLIGKTDFDLDTPDHAALLRQEEVVVMQSGQPLTDKQELVTDPDGRAYWFETAKVALTSRTGRVIGLAGTTRDITVRKTLEASLELSRARMEMVLSEMSDGLAVVGADGYIVLSNEQYRQLFPLTGKYRVPGAFMPQILDASKEQGEQVDFDLPEISRIMREGGNVEVNLFNGNWLQLRVRPNSSGGCTLIASDITKLKRDELDMRSMAKQLEILAATDGLTGLLNRRSLDDRLDKEIARCRRGRLPISLIMIDIDRFKAFNDHYGHPQGDACLQRVADALQTGARRPGDLVTRYGGEEIAIVLPETDAAGAFVLAEQLRLAVRGLAIEHAASELGIVTISAGVASLVHDGIASTAAELKTRADEALYRAKDAGRDRVMGWNMTPRERLPQANSRA